MSQRKENILLLVSVAIAACLLAVVASKLIENRNGSGSKTTDKTPLPSVEDRISFGEKFLVKKEEIGERADFRAAKQRGASAMAAGNYEEAARNFKEAREEYPNAPETLIYLNNALVGNSKSYTIAVVVPATTAPNPALEVLRGVAQAQDEINKAGGIKGVPLKVAIARDDNDPEVAKKIASALAANSKVLGVVGHLTSGATLAAGEVYDSEKLVAISATSTSVELSGKYDWVFRTVPSNTLMARALSEAMANQLQKQKAAIFFTKDKPFSESLKFEFTGEGRLKGIEIVANFDLSSRTFSPDQSVKEARRKGAQVLMLAPTEEFLDKAFHVVKANRQKLDLLGADTLYSFKTLDVGADAVGMLVAVPWHIESDSSDFPDRSRTLWSGANVSWVTAMTYDAMRAFIAAIEQSSSPTRSGIRNALVSEDFFATGAADAIILFKENGDRRNAPVQLVEVRPADPSNPSRSGTGHNFVPIQ